MLPDDLVNQLIEFRKERDWEQFHTPRNLSSALCTEAAELLEHFRWAKDTEVDGLVTKNIEMISEEIADIAILLAYLAHDLELSIPDIVSKKILLNRRKYPVEKCKGVATKYDRL